MYTNDKNQRITLRLNEAQFSFVKKSSEVLGVSPSDYLRMLVNSFMSVQSKIDQAAQELKEGAGRENDKANFNGKL